MKLACVRFRYCKNLSNLFVLDSHLAASPFDLLQCGRLFFARLLDQLVQLLTLKATCKPGVMLKISL